MSKTERFTATTDCELILVQFANVPTATLHKTMWYGNSGRWHDRFGCTKLYFDWKYI